MESLWSPTKQNMDLPPPGKLELDELSNALNAYAAPQQPAPPAKPSSKNPSTKKDFKEKSAPTKTTTKSTKTSSKTPKTPQPDRLNTQSLTQNEPNYDRWTIKDNSAIDYGVASTNIVNDTEEKPYYITTAINYANGEWMDRLDGPGGWSE